LYFSERENSVSSDLYISHMLSEGKYSTPVKLALSTASDDLAPFIGPDQKTLYFASGRPAKGKQGGIDFYRSTRLDDTWTKWSPPVNLGQPINTSAEDLYFTIDREGKVFSSRAIKAYSGSNLDLFMLVPKTLYVKLEGNVFNEKNNEPVDAKVEITMVDRDPTVLQSGQSGRFETRFVEVEAYDISAAATGFLPKKLSYELPLLYQDTVITVNIPLTPVAKKLVVSGSVYDKKTQTPIAAKVMLASLKSNQPVNDNLLATNGKYEKTVPRLGWYLLTASAEGYLSATDSVALESEDLSPVIKDLFLEPIEVGVTVRLKNIYFDFDKTTLKRESYTELNKVVDFLKQNPTVEIEIAGHTDAKGSDDYNLNLSQGRSQSVVDYIISQGIQSSRLVAHGYGEGKPIDTNDTTEGQANNRRVEFTILKK